MRRCCRVEGGEALGALTQHNKTQNPKPYKIDTFLKRAGVGCPYHEHKKRGTFTGVKKFARGLDTALRYRRPGV